MAFFVPFVSKSGDLEASERHRLFASAWLNLLQSKTPMLLGPRPLSTFGILITLREQLIERRLRTGTLASHCTAALGALRQSSWLTHSFPNIDYLIEALGRFADNREEQGATQCVAAISELLDTYGDRRVSAHVQHLLGLRAGAIHLVQHETSDLLADLIALGHSESYLFRWGRYHLLEAEEPLLDRIAQVGELGRPRRFAVGFSIAPSIWVHTPPEITVGRIVGNLFACAEGFPVPEGHTLALVHVIAADYKAAIEQATTTFSALVRHMPPHSRRERVRITGDSFLVKCQDTGEDKIVRRDELRPFVLPPFRFTSRTGYIDAASPQLTKPLNQCLYWLSTASANSDEAQFISIWLALISLLEEDAPARLISLLARYRLLAAIHYTAAWVVEYLKLAAQVDPQLAPRIQTVIGRKEARKSVHSRLSSIIRELMSRPPWLVALRRQDALIQSRLHFLETLANQSTRDHLLNLQEEDLMVLVPAARTTRNSIAHLAGVSASSVALINRSLFEDVSLVAEQVAASGLGRCGSTVAAVHETTTKEFHALVDATFSEAHMSILHVRQEHCNWSDVNASVVGHA